LELIDRVQRLDMDSYLNSLEDQYEEKREEINRLEQKLEETRKEVAARKAKTEPSSTSANHGRAA
jgi:hypothetical protein